MNAPLTFRTDAEIVKPREKAAFLKQASLVGDRWKILRWTLPFLHSGCVLLECTDDSHVGALRHYFLKTTENFIRVEYKTGWVEAQLKAYGVPLTRDSVDEYVRFYLGFTRGQAGHVIPIEDVDHLPLREELTLITRRKLQSVIVPLHVIDATNVDGCFLIKDKLFAARAVIGADGVVMLEPQKLLADTIPILDDVFES